jgi:hypothetical protein
MSATKLPRKSESEDTRIPFTVGSGWMRANEKLVPIQKSRSRKCHPTLAFSPLVAPVTRISEAEPLFLHLIFNCLGICTTPPFLNSPRTTTHGPSSLLPIVPCSATDSSTGRLVEGSPPTSSSSNDGSPRLPFYPPESALTTDGPVRRSTQLRSPPERQLDDSIRVPFPPRIFLGTASG